MIAVASLSGTRACALCGQERASDAGLCAYHNGASEAGWAAVNRIMCDFFHRGIIPTRLSAAARGDDAAGVAAEAA